MGSTCPIAHLAPYAFQTKNLTTTFLHHHYPVCHKNFVIDPLVKRPTRFYQFMYALFPSLGSIESEKAIVNISATLEIVQNATVDVLKNLQLEISSLSQLVIQNRWAIYYLLVSQRGVCVLSNTTCFYANKSRQIEYHINIIQRQVRTFHQTTQATLVRGSIKCLVLAVVLVT